MILSNTDLIRTAKIAAMLQCSTHEAVALYDTLREHVEVLAGSTPFSYRSLWGPAWLTAKTLMAYGFWSLEIWKEEVDRIVQHKLLRSRIGYS